MHGTDYLVPSSAMSRNTGKKYSPSKVIAQRKNTSSSKAKEMTDDERKQLISRKVVPKMSKHKVSNIPVRKSRLTELAVNPSEKKSSSKIPVPKSNSYTRKSLRINKKENPEFETIKTEPRKETPPDSINSNVDINAPIIPLSPGSIEMQMAPIAAFGQTSSSNDATPLKINFESDGEYDIEEEEFYVEQMLDNSKTSSEYLNTIGNMIENTLKLAQTTPAASQEIFDIKADDSDVSEHDAESNVFSTQQRDSDDSIDNEIVDIQIDSLPRSPFSAKKH